MCANRVILDKALFHKKVNDDDKSEKQDQKPVTKEMLEDAELPMLKKLQDRKTERNTVRTSVDTMRSNKEAIKGLIG